MRSMARFGLHARTVRTVSDRGRQCRTQRSRGPWLAGGLFCPARSWLTMASSEPLAPSRRLISWFRRRVFACRPGPRGSPIYSACPFCPCRLPYPGGPVGGRDCWFSVRASLHPNVKRLGVRECSTPVGSCVVWDFGAAKFALCCGPASCSPSTDIGLLHSSFRPRSHLQETSSITTRANSQLPRPDLHRLDTQPYGLRDISQIALPGYAAGPCSTTLRQPP